MMKTKFIVMLIAFVVSATYSYAQTINGVSVAEIEANYIQLIAVPSTTPEKYNLYISIGQDKPRKTRGGTSIEDAEGNKLTFSTVIQGLNFLKKCGYKLTHVYTHSSSSIEYFILEKE